MMHGHLQQMVSSQWRGDEVESSDDESSKDGSCIGNSQYKGTGMPSSLPKTFLGVLISRHQDSQPSNPLNHPTTINIHNNTTVSAHTDDGTPKRPTTHNVDNDNKKLKPPYFELLPSHSMGIKQSKSENHC